MSDATFSAAAASVSAPADGAMVEDPAKEEKEDQPEGKEPNQYDKFLAGCFMQNDKQKKGHYVLCRVIENYGAPRFGFSIKEGTLKHYPIALKKKTAALRKELKSLKGEGRVAIMAEIEDLQEKLKTFNENKDKTTVLMYKGKK